MKVYQAISPNFGMGPTPSFPDAYELVANVDTDDLDAAFQLTNTIDCPWWDNEGVEVINKARSTSVGDIIVSEDGSRHLCENFGWKTL